MTEEAKDQPGVDQAKPSSPASRLAAIDESARQQPWIPRMAPWFAYMVIMAGTLYVRDALPQAYGPAKVLQAIVICWMIWRWRKLTPEVNWKFHWSVIPVSVFLTAAWVWMGVSLQPIMGPDETTPSFWGMTVGPDNRTPTMWGWVSAVGHLVAMTTAVPLIEETFNRSLVLRSTQRARDTWTGIVQFICDFPLIGDMLMNTKAGMKATQAEPMFTKQFKETALGELTLFGVIFSSLVFAMVHINRDKPAAILCGVTWCLMLRFTRHKGLGPVIWSHALTNLLLWGWIIYRDVAKDDPSHWMFM